MGNRVDQLGSFITAQEPLTINNQNISRRTGVKVENEGFSLVS